MWMCASRSPLCAPVPILAIRRFGIIVSWPQEYLEIPGDIIVPTLAKHDASGKVGEAYLTQYFFGAFEPCHSAPLLRARILVYPPPAVSLSPRPCVHTQAPR